MVDLSAEMAELWGSLGAPPAGRARVIQVAAARRGEGTSTVARELAQFAARRAGRSVWLVDLDLAAAAQIVALDDEPDRFGALGEAAAASPDGSAFFTVQPPTRGQDGKLWPDARFLTAHRVGQARWWVTRFRRELVQPGQNIHILPKSDYWAALRRHADLIIVDAPSADRSKAALTIAPHMDATLLVVSAGQTDTQATTALRDGITAAGGTVAGLFLNRMMVETPGFLRTLGL